MTPRSRSVRRAASPVTPSAVTPLTPAPTIKSTTRFRLSMSTSPPPRNGVGRTEKTPSNGTRPPCWDTEGYQKGVEVRRSGGPEERRLPALLHNRQSRLEFQEFAGDLVRCRRPEQQLPFAHRELVRKGERAKGHGIGQLERRTTVGVGGED